MKRKLFRFYIKHKQFIITTICFTLNFFLLMIFLYGMLEINYLISWFITMAIIVPIDMNDSKKRHREERNKYIIKKEKEILKQLNKDFKPISPIIYYEIIPFEMKFEDELYQLLYEKEHIRFHKERYFKDMNERYDNFLNKYKQLVIGDDELFPFPMGGISVEDPVEKNKPIKLSELIEKIETKREELKKDFEEDYNTFFNSMLNEEVFDEVNKQYIVQIRKHKINKLKQNGRKD